MPKNNPLGNYIHADDVDRVADDIVGFVNPEYNHGISTKTLEDENLRPTIEFYEAIIEHAGNYDMYESELTRARTWLMNCAQIIKHSLIYNLRTIYGN